VALAIFLASAGWLVGGLYLLDEEIDSFRRVPIPGEGEVSLDHSGGYVIYYEGPGAADRRYDTFTFDVTPRSESAAVQDIQLYEGSLTYSFGSREGRAIFTLRVSSPGTFLIETEAPAASGDSSLAIGSSIAGRIVAIAIPSGLLMVVAIAGAIAIAIIRHRRMRRSRTET
jgi:hypothetical protein